MKNLKLLLIALTAFIFMAGTCEPDEQKEPAPESCNCHIQGTKQISTDGGVTWQYAGTDERSGLLFPCSYDGVYTNQETTPEGTKYRTFWECRKE